MSRLSSAARVTAALAILLTLVAGFIASGAAAQGGDRITVAVDVYQFDQSLSEYDAFPQPYTYSQSGPPDQQALSPAANAGTVLAFREDGPIVGQADVSPDGTATLDLPVGPFFISITGDDGPGSYVDQGTADTNWVIIINPTAGQGPAEPTSAPTVPAAEPTATAEGGTGENPANAEPTGTTAADTADVDESADPSADASADSGADPSAAPGAAGTGSPAAIYAGTCDTADFTGNPVAVLSETTAPEGESQGADDASAVEISTTTLGLPLDDILAEDHVLVVFDEGDDTVVLACGPIGGIMMEDGTLAFGLAAVDESRFSGVAYLTEDGDQTQATIFLAENLSGAEGTPEA